jgi:hypothetical protein
MYSSPTHSTLVSSLSKEKVIMSMLTKNCTRNPNQLIPFSFSLHIRENDELSTPENQISQLQIFPNPTENTLNLKLSNQPIQEIVVFDLQGRVIFQENKSCTSNNSQIDVSDFSNGIYIVQVMSAQGIVSSSKFIKK